MPCREPSDQELTVGLEAVLVAEKATIDAQPVCQHSGSGTSSLLAVGALEARGLLDRTAGAGDHCWRYMMVAKNKEVEWRSLALGSWPTKKSNPKSRARHGRCTIRMTRVINIAEIDFQIGFQIRELTDTMGGCGKWI